MINSSYIKQKEIEEIEEKVKQILCEKFYTGAEHISQLSEIDLFYLYGEIVVMFDVFLTIKDIEEGCFSSLHQLACAIQEHVLYKRT